MKFMLLTKGEHIMELKERIRLEKEIVTKVLKAALSKGYAITVYDPEERVIFNCKEIGLILEAMFSTDEDIIVMRKYDEEIHNFTASQWVHFVYGNDGCDVINDFHLKDLLANVNKIIDKYS